MRITVVRLVVVVLLATGLSLPGAATGEEPVPASGWQPREQDHASVVTTSDVRVPVSDGLELLADVRRPADADGRVVEEPLPVLLTITAYNKSVLSTSFGSLLAGSDPDYLVKRGYVQVTVDARGTGISPGVWDVFGAREQLDAKEVVEWAARQPWSDGRVGMSGPSYMGISQLFAAGQQPEGLRAIFPQVPTAEVYRDVVASGGQLDAGFMPLWLGLVNLTGFYPATSGEVTPEEMFRTYTSRLTQGVPGSLSLLASALTGGENAYDGPFYEERSPMLRSVPTIDVPTFLVGGHDDLFQRGTPEVFQALDDRGVDVKMILGPWNHLQASSGEGIEAAGYGSLAELQLRWFDHHVKDLPDPTLDADIADFTLIELGSEQVVRRETYLGDQRARSFSLSGTSLPVLGGGRLSEGPAGTGSSTILPVPVAGLCSRSTSQWTAGLTAAALPINPCDQDNGVNDLTGAVYDSEPLDEELAILGPINARLHVSSTTGDGLLSVHVSRVTPDGRVQRLTGGWQVISLAALDESRSVVVDGEIVRPWHPFTEESRRVRAPGEITPVDVEVFPTGARLFPGDRLRISVQSFDVPHLLPPLPQVVGSLGVTTIHHGPEHDSRLILPVVGVGGDDDAAIVDAVRDALGGDVPDQGGQTATEPPASTTPPAPPASAMPSSPLASLLRLLGLGSLLGL